MGNGKIIIGIFAVLLIVLALFVGGMEPVPETIPELPVSFCVASGDGREEIFGWQAGDGSFYVFLPGGAELQDVTFAVKANAEVRVDGIPVIDGMSCDFLQTDRNITVCWEEAGKPAQGRLTVLKGSGIPSMYIETNSGSMDYIHLDKNYEESGRIRLYDEKGALLLNSPLGSIKGRGNSSWAAEKKPYNLTFAEETDLLGMGAAQRWILVAEGFSSCVNIRNKIVYDFADSAGLAYSPDTRWVDLYLNGTYAGLYLLSERNEIHADRVDISGEDGFLVSLEYEYRMQDAGHPYVRTDSGQTLRIHSSGLELRDLDSMWQSVENAILAENFTDPVTGKYLFDLIDLDSWARKYLLEELFGNPDGGSLSQFFYGTADGRIFAGPVWDSDMAMGGYHIWLRPYTDYFVMNRDHKEAGYATPWFYALYRNETFRQRVVELYRSEFLPMTEKLLQEDLEAYIASVSDSQTMDGVRWGYSRKTIDGEMAYIQHFLKARTDFLTDLWINDSKYHVVRVDTGKAEVYGYLAVKPGEQLPELPSYEMIRGLGWFRADNDEPFDITQPIYEDVQIYVKTVPFQIPKIHYVPAIGLVGMLAILALINVGQMRKNGRQKHDRETKTKISA